MGSDQLEHLDITPDPKVLLALTQTPLRPIDALCELIDNGIDSVRAAAGGTDLRQAVIQVNIPGPTEVARGEGVIRVADNGLGLDRAGLANALRAGYSGKNKYDALGLFGMGFNIATGKFGRRTRVTTARADDKYALMATVDLPRLVERRSFEVPVEQVPKPPNFVSGTIVEVDHWWPEGDPNAKFALMLAQLGRPTVRTQLGRRYATLLHPGNELQVQLIVNREQVEGFEHCVWSESRFVERAGWGAIPAKISFDKVLAAQRRCVADGTVLQEGQNQCLECGGTATRTVEERVRGWVGIQRFDDNNRFGIDLIRNGRAIRIQEKDAFFSYVDELGEAIKEYPTDQQSGRIVGEVHLDHVPVDFQKQDFQRTSGEWSRAIEFLRGGSLLPSKWPDGEKNRSPVSTLFQGYRKVRNFGRADMYMGRYDPASKKAVRISRDIEQEYYERFLRREPGYYDDERWWELVESATVPPLLEMEECPDCGYQNLPESEVCQGCERVLHGRPCVACGATIPLSELSCPMCGASQVPEVAEPWRCAICGAVNPVDDEHCTVCEHLRGTENPYSLEALLRRSTECPDLSFDSHQFVFVDGVQSEPVEAKCFHATPLKARWDGEDVPSLVFRAPGALTIFIDPAHAAFTRFGERHEDVVATEVAHYVHSMRSELRGHPGNTLANLTTSIVRELWSDRLVVRPESTRERIRALTSRLQELIVAHPSAADYYTELDQDEQRELADRLIASGNLEELPALVQSGRYLKYVSLSTIARFFEFYPEWWFGPVWREALPEDGLLGGYGAKARGRIIRLYMRCLEDCAAYVASDDTNDFVSQRAAASLGFLEAALA